MARSLRPSVHQLEGRRLLTLLAPTYPAGTHPGAGVAAHLAHVPPQHVRSLPLAQATVTSVVAVTATPMRHGTRLPAAQVSTQVMGKNRGLHGVAHTHLNLGGILAYPFAVPYFGIAALFHKTM